MRWPRHCKSNILECNKYLTLLSQPIYLFFIAPLSFLDVELFPGSLPILGQFVDVGGQGLVGGGRLIQLFPQHGIHMGQTGTPVIKKYIIKLNISQSFFFICFFLLLWLWIWIYKYLKTVRLEIVYIFPLKKISFKNLSSFNIVFFLHENTPVHVLWKLTYQIHTGTFNKKKILVLHVDDLFAYGVCCLRYRELWKPWLNDYIY